MSMHFEFKTISELIEDNYCRQQKQFTLEELSKYDGSNGKPAYVAVEGIVYDLSKVAAWSGGTHFDLKAGKDLTNEFNSHHGVIKKLSSIPKVGILTVTKEKNIETVTRVALVDTYDFSPNDWVQYITPLVNSALEEVNSGIRLEHVFQKFILISIFVGQGRTFQEATNLVEEWERTGMSKLLNESR